MLETSVHPKVERFLTLLHVNFSIDTSLRLTGLSRAELHASLEANPDLNKIFTHFCENQSELFAQKMAGLGREYLLSIFTQRGYRVEKRKVQRDADGQIISTIEETTLQPIPSDMIRFALTGSPEDQQAQTQKESISVKDRLHENLDQAVTLLLEGN